ncbi:arabinogalactan protein 12 [Dendrobium catenatum]|uniref:arabinogalactan protein 12 n=1 Tax=Dendrobium catenatum TaxID=906689 RepID=UPI0009F4138D|nr:arabinogalactan protein 12 [Dendrobium catenatum]
MEASMMLKLITAVLVAIVAASSLVEQAAAADAPAPSPTSGSVTTSPALVFSFLSALLVGHLFC